MHEVCQLNRCRQGVLESDSACAGSLLSALRQRLDLLPTYTCELRPDSDIGFLKAPLSAHNIAHGYDCARSRRVAVSVPRWNAIFSMVFHSSVRPGLLRANSDFVKRFLCF